MSFDHMLDVGTEDQESILIRDMRTEYRDDFPRYMPMFIALNNSIAASMDIDNPLTFNKVAHLAIQSAVMWSLVHGSRIEKGAKWQGDTEFADKLKDYALRIIDFHAKECKHETESIVDTSMDDGISKLREFFA